MKHLENQESGHAEATSQPLETKSKEPRQIIHDTLLRIGGIEVSIRLAQEEKDWEYIKILKRLRTKYYQQLRKAAYGLED